MKLVGAGALSRGAARSLRDPDRRVFVRIQGRYRRMAQPGDFPDVDRPQIALGCCVVEPDEERQVA